MFGYFEGQTISTKLKISKIKPDTCAYYEMKMIFRVFLKKRLDQTKKDSNL